MSSWYYFTHDGRQGPFDLDALRALLAQGRVAATTMVWTAGMPDWTPANQVPALAGAQPPSAPLTPGHIIARMSSKVNVLTGTERVDAGDVGGLFSEVLKKHDEEELERVFAAGLRATTPAIADIPNSPPSPWVYSRVLVFFGVTFLVLYLTWREYENINLLPGLILIGSFAFPLAAALFFYECNVTRNLSLFMFAKAFVWGGVLGIALSLALFQLSDAIGSIIGAPIAGLIEEPGKLAAVILLARAARYRWTLNGMCLGAAVGAGFAAFESAGYALQFLLEEGADGMMSAIGLRGIFEPFTHVVWTAITAGALWRVRQGRPFDFDMLKDRRFLAPMIAAMAIHAIWNSPLPAHVPFMGGYIALGAISWIIAVGMMLGALKEVREAQGKPNEARGMPTP